MPKGESSPQKWEKTSEFYKKKGDKSWAIAKNDPDKGHEFINARESYKKAEYYAQKSKNEKSKKG